MDSDMIILPMSRIIRDNGRDGARAFLSSYQTVYDSDTGLFLPDKAIETLSSITSRLDYQNRAYQNILL